MGSVVQRERASRVSRARSSASGCYFMSLKPRVGEDGDVCGVPMRFGKLFGSITPAHKTCTYLDVPKFAQTKRFKDALHELAAFGR